MGSPEYSRLLFGALTWASIYHYLFLVSVDAVPWEVGECIYMEICFLGGKKSKLPLLSYMDHARAPVECP